MNTQEENVPNVSMKDFLLNTDDALSLCSFIQAQIINNISIFYLEHKMTLEEFSLELSKEFSGPQVIFSTVMRMYHTAVALKNSKMVVSLFDNEVTFVCKMLDNISKASVSSEAPTELGSIQGALARLQAAFEADLGQESPKVETQTPKFLSRMDLN